MASPEKSLGRKRGRPKGSKKDKKKSPRHMHIERADNGGFHVRHSYDSPSPDSEEQASPDTTHSLGDPNALLAHVQDNFGGQMPDQSAAGPGAAAAPAMNMQSGG